MISKVQYNQAELGTDSREERIITSNGHLGRVLEFRPHRRTPRRLRLACALLLAAAVLAAGCERLPAAIGLVEVHERLYALQLDGIEEQNPEAQEPQVDPRDLSHAQVLDGAGMQFLSASKMIEEVGVLDFMEGYIFNIPPTAAFLTGFELATARRATAVLHPDDDAANIALRAFEDRVVRAATEVLADGLLPSNDPQKLRVAFFDAFDQCGRASPWPVADLYVGGDPDAGDYPGRLVVRDFGISYFEYKELLHECGRFAATYPTLDEAVRDELLAAQRAHYAQAVLAGLEEPPLVAIPATYRDEIDELRQIGARPVR